MRPPQNQRLMAKGAGIALLVLGAGLAALALLADWLEIGGGEGFGYQQLIVLIVGIVLILSGLRIVIQPLFNRMNSSPDSSEYER